MTGNKTSVLATQVWGTEDKDAVSLAACLLEQRPVKVSPERSERDDTAQDKHHKRLKAAAATVTARAKADELNRRFGDWLWEHPDRTADLVKTYNERFNSLVLRSYDGAQPALPGLAGWFREWVHPHQLAAVARIINEPAVLLAHDVGAGKTAEMAMGAMELRRLGLAAKPAIVVPNHMLEQFQREFLQLYPQARVLAAGTDDLKALGRHQFTARIATGNWDAVIMSQSVFERIPMSAPEIERYISVQLAGYDAWLERAREAQQSKRMIKKMETRKLMREQRLRRKLDRARDGGICWEQTGIDYLFVDEAHHYKNLDIRSNNQELDIDGSGRASDLEMKLDYLRTTHGRRVVTFATATPIANSMTEAYVMCRYLRPDLLADAGIEDFDAWVGTFAETTTDVEVAPEGGIRVKDRFARFRNLPELLNMWRVAADVKTKEDLKLPVPELAGGKPEVVPVEPPEQLLEFMRRLASRAEAVRSHSVLPDEDNMLKISNDGRLAALDPRLAGLAAPETGKLDVAAQNIARIEHEHRDHRYYDGEREPAGRHGQPPDRLLRPRHPRRQEPLERLRIPARQARRVRHRPAHDPVHARGQDRQGQGRAVRRRPRREGISPDRLDQPHGRRNQRAGHRGRAAPPGLPVAARGRGPARRPHPAPAQQAPPRAHLPVRHRTQLRRLHVADRHPQGQVHRPGHPRQDHRARRGGHRR